jgi:hypothetical protein
MCRAPIAFLRKSARTQIDRYRKAWNSPPVILQRDILVSTTTNITDMPKFHLKKRDISFFDSVNGGHQLARDPCNPLRKQRGLETCNRSLFSIVWTFFCRSPSPSICPLARLPAWDTADSLIPKRFPIVLMNRSFLAAGDWVHELSSGKPMIQPTIQSALPRRSFSEGWSILSNSNDTIESNSFNVKLMKS